MEERERENFEAILHRQSMSTLNYREFEIINCRVGDDIKHTILFHEIITLCKKQQYMHQKFLHFYSCFRMFCDCDNCSFKQRIFDKISIIFDDNKCIYYFDEHLLVNKADILSQFHFNLIETIYDCNFGGFFDLNADVKYIICENVAFGNFIL